MRIVIIEFISLDGVVQAPGGADEDRDGGFAHGGWSHPFFDETVGGGFNDALTKADALLFGRRTWQTMAAAWPERAGDPFADRMNSIPKHVVSTTLETADWNNTTILDADPFARIREIKASQNVLTWGSAQLVQGMLAEGLVDELVLLYSPIVLGAGKRLFAEGARHDLRVVESTPLEGGMLALRLAAAR